jgi:hypothetical protein
MPTHRSLTGHSPPTKPPRCSISWRSVPALRGHRRRLSTRGPRRAATRPHGRPGRPHIAPQRPIGGQASWCPDASNKLHVAVTPAEQPLHLVFSGLTDAPSRRIVVRSLARAETPATMAPGCIRSGPDRGLHAPFGHAAAVPRPGTVAATRERCRKTRRKRTAPAKARHEAKAETPGHRAHGTHPLTGRTRSDEERTHGPSRWSPRPRYGQRRAHR